MFCRPAQAVPIPVRMVVVASFNTGDDSDEGPGEFHLWVKREHLDEAIPVRGALHPVRRNKQGLYGIVPGNAGHMVNADGEALTAFVLDPRYDFRHTYWLFTGISGVDPKVGTVGTAAWASFVINGDELRELDDREIPRGWSSGLFAIGSDRPDRLPSDPKHFGSASTPDVLSMVYALNPGLTRWAYDLTKRVALPDTPALAAERAGWTGFPAAQQPPIVILGDTLGSVRYWHGVMRTRWAEGWASLWTHGRGRFAMSNMESQTYMDTMYVLARQGLVDLNRVMVLRTASNFTEPLPGQSPVASVGDEGPGQDEAYESNYRAGAPVVHEILAHWARYASHVPQAE
nr:purine nucleoside permease [uncultured Lichenicoccus sp.]